MTIVIGAREARRRFADLLGRVGYGGEVAIVERSGKPMVALIPVEVYEQLVAEREARFQVPDCIRSRLPETPKAERSRLCTLNRTAGRFGCFRLSPRRALSL